MSGKLLSSLVVILCIALLVGFFLLLGSITGIHPSQAGIMLIAPPYLTWQVMVRKWHELTKNLKPKKPRPHTEVKVIDPATGKTVPCGQRGEICTRGYLVMAGYYKMPEKTAEAIDREGWLHTGDLAMMDAQGYVNIVGRLKDMVIRGGENLFPAEIEEFLIHHPKVADAQVLGVPDVFFGEELLAVVRLKEGVQLTAQELRDYCQGQISHQKIPRYFQFVDAYPLTASGKVQKFVLRENAIRVLGLEEVAKTKTA